MRRATHAVWGLVLALASGCGETEIATTRPPTAFAGFDTQATVGAEVALDGSQSLDPDGDPLEFRWRIVRRPPGSQAYLRPFDEPLTRLEPDVPGTYVVVLTVFDGALEDRDLVGVEATATSTAPEPLGIELDRQSCNVAFGSPPTGPCISGGAVQLSPATIDAPKTPQSALSVQWLFVRLPAGLAAEDLSPEWTGLGPLRFSPPRPGEYWVGARLVGPRTLSAPRFATVRVHPPGTDLSAVPDVRLEGPHTTSVRAPIVLDASAVFATHPETELQWRLLTDPSEGLATLTDRNTGCRLGRCRTFVAPAPGDYVVELVGRTATATAATALFPIEVTP